MRGTVFVLPADLLPIAFAATRLTGGGISLALIVVWKAANPPWGRSRLKKI